MRRAIVKGNKSIWGHKRNGGFEIGLAAGVRMVAVDEDKIKGALQSTKDGNTIALDQRNFRAEKLLNLGHPICAADMGVLIVWYKIFK